MKKSELCSAVADKAGMTKGDATKAVEAVFDEIAAQVSKGEEVNVGGFGTFLPKTRKAREGRNPATGQTIQIPEKTSLSLRPAVALRDL